MSSFALVTRISINEVNIELENGLASVREKQDKNIDRNSDCGICVVN